MYIYMYIYIYDTYLVHARTSCSILLYRNSLHTIHMFYIFSSAHHAHKVDMNVVNGFGKHKVNLFGSMVKVNSISAKNGHQFVNLFGSMVKANRSVPKMVISDFHALSRLYGF